MSEIYRGYNLNNATTPKPWAPRETTYIKGHLDSTHADCITTDIDITGHKHAKLYSPTAVIGVQVGAAGDCRVASLVGAAGIVLNDAPNGSLSSVAVLPIALGGTNSAAALSNSRVMVSDTGAIVESTVTTTELGILSGKTLSTGVADNDRLVTQGYVDDAISGEDFWTRAAGVISLQTPADSLKIDSLGTGVVHSDTAGLFSSSAVVNADLGNLGTAGKVPKFGATGLADSVITELNSNIGIGTSLPGSHKLHVAYAPTVSASFASYINYEPTDATSGTRYHKAAWDFISPVTAAGATNSGYIIGRHVGVITDLRMEGTQASVWGQWIQYGQSGGTGAVTDSAGLVLSPYYATGTIGDMYAIRVLNSTIGGTLSGSKYGVSVEDTGMLNYFAGTTSVGTSAIASMFNIGDINRTSNSVNMEIMTSDSYAIDKGGKIGLGGKYRASGAQTSFGAIRGGKENATDENYAGYLSLMTVPAGGVLTDRVKITSDGIVGIDTTTIPSWKNTYSVLHNTDEHAWSTDGGSSYTTSRAYFDTGDSRWEYIQAGRASRIEQAHDRVSISVAAVGALANDPITAWPEKLGVYGGAININSGQDSCDFVCYDDSGVEMFKTDASAGDLFSDRLKTTEAEHNATDGILRCDINTGEIYPETPA